MYAIKINRKIIGNRTRLHATLEYPALHINVNTHVQKQI